MKHQQKRQEKRTGKRIALLILTELICNATLKQIFVSRFILLNSSPTRLSNNEIISDYQFLLLASGHIAILCHL